MREEGQSLSEAEIREKPKAEEVSPWRKSQRKKKPEVHRNRNVIEHSEWEAFSIVQASEQKRDNKDVSRSIV